MTMKSIATIGIIFLLSGCSSSLLEENPNNSIFIQAEGILQKKTSDIFSNEYEVMITPWESIHFSEKNADIKTMENKKIIISGVLTQDASSGFNSLENIQITSSSSDWSSIFFKTIEGNISLPDFITTKEENNTLILLEKDSPIILFEKTSPSKNLENETEIILKNGEKVLRTTEKNSISIFYEKYGIKATMIQKEGDSSFLYSILETYTKTSSSTQKTNENSQKKINWEQETIHKLYDEYTDIKSIRKIKINKDFLDIEYLAPDKTLKRMFFEHASISELKMIAKYQLNTTGSTVWEKTEGEIPSSASFFWKTTLSSTFPPKIPDGFTWFYSDTLGIQFAYPKEMYYFVKENQTMFVWNLGPNIASSPKDTRSFFIRKSNHSTSPFEMIFSDDFPKETKDVILKSVISY